MELHFLGSGALARHPSTRAAAARAVELGLDLQFAGAGGGRYATNTFTNLGAPMFIGGSGLVTANYTDIGGATNTPARYYRVRLVP